jgi:hypothetical protein
MDRWRRPIEFLTTIVTDILPDEVLTVAGMQMIVEQATMGQGQSCSTNRGNRPAQSDHGPHCFRDLGYFSVRPGLTTRENQNICRFGHKRRQREVRHYFEATHAHDCF